MMSAPIQCPCWGTMAGASGHGSNSNAPPRPRARRSWTHGLSVLLNLMLVHFVSGVLSDRLREAGAVGFGIEWALAGLDRRDVFGIKGDVKDVRYATAGQPLTLQLEAREHANMPYTSSEWHVFAVLQAGSITRHDVHCQIHYQAPGQYDVRVVGEAPGTFNLSTSVGIPGIKVSFFDRAPAVGTPFLERLYPSVAWDSMVDMQGNSVRPSGVRWEGAIRPGLSGNYSFTLEIDGRVLHEDACLKIGETYHLACKDRGILTHVRPSVRLSAWKFEPFSLELINPPPGRLRLMWQSPQLMPEIVPPDVIFALVPIRQQAVQIRVAPGEADARESVATKLPPVLAPGQQVAVTTETRDKYGTLTDAQSTVVVAARHLKDGVRHTTTPAARSGFGTYEANLIPHTVSGLVAVSSSLVQCPGVHATYYSDTNLAPSSAAKAAAAPAIDFSAAHKSPPVGSSLPVNTPYSIRWAGMLQPLHAQTHTIVATLQTAAERVKVWVDNALLINTWSSLQHAVTISATVHFAKTEGHVYDIRVEYQVAPAGNRGLSLQWSRAGVNGAAQPLTMPMCRATHLRASLVEILPGPPKASMSELRQCADSVAQMMAAGDQLCLQLLLRDEWNNSAQPDMSGVEVSGRDLLERPLPMPDFMDVASEEAHARTTRTLMFSVTAAGRFSVHIKIDGTHVRASPLSVLVLPGPPSPSSWRYQGSALSLSTAGALSTFTVYAADEHGNTVSNADISFSGLYPKPLLSSSGNAPHVASRALESFQMIGGQVELTYLVTLSALYQADLAYNGIALPSSPFTCTVQPAEADAAASQMLGPGLTLTTAGVLSSFRILARDRFGNNVSDAADSLHITLRKRPELARDVLVNVTHRFQGEYIAVYENFIPSVASVRSFLVKTGGIQATYFSDASLRFPAAVKATTSATIDFSAVGSDAPPASSLPSNSTYSIRWAGMLRQQARNVTMRAARQSAGERVKVWLDNRLVIDMWSSLGGAMEKSSAVTFDVAGGYYEIQVEYSVNATNLGSRGLQLLWQPSLDPAFVVPGSVLGTALPLEPQHPLVTTVAHQFCASTSSVSGSGLTVLTVGVTASLRIRSRDQFRNLRENDDILLGVSRSTAPGVRILTVSGIYTQGINAGGVSQTRFTGMIPGGLFATYYSNRLFTNAVAVTDSVNIGGGMRDLANYMGVRWGGYLAPTLSDTYSFSLSGASFSNISLYDSDESYLLGISTALGSAEPVMGSLYLSAGQYYKIDIMYWHVTGTPQLSLQWSSAGTNGILQHIASEHLISRLDLIGSPSTTQVNSAALCTSTSSISGPGLTTVTAGGVMIFFIQTKDRFSNAFTRIAPEPIIADYVPESRQTRAVRAISSYNALGQWDVLILGLTVSGKYKTLVSLARQGGIAATYFDDSAPASNSVASPFAVPVATSLHTSLSISPSNASAFLTSLSANAFSVRWMGFISSPNVLRNFSASLGSADERVRIWIDNLIVIDQWTSLAGTVLQTHKAFAFKEESTPYLLEIEYRQETGNYSFDLRWNRISNLTTNVTFDRIPASYLFELIPFADSPYQTLAQASTESGKCCVEPLMQARPAQALGYVGFR